MVDIYRYGYWRYTHHINNGKLPGHQSSGGKPDKEPSLSVSLRLRRSFSVGAWLSKKV
jgi:hypothetical protein